MTNVSEVDVKELKQKVQKQEEAVVAAEALVKEIQQLMMKKQELDKKEEELTNALKSCGFLDTSHNHVRRLLVVIIIYIYIYITMLFHNINSNH